MWLLRLPRVASVVPARSRMAAVISLTVVLPLLPATPTMGIENCARQAAAEVVRAAWVSGTTICASGRSTGRIDHGARRARGLRGGDEIVGVEARPAQRDEQLAGFERARIGGHAGVGAIGAAQRAAAGLREFEQRAAHAVPPVRVASAAATTF